MTQEIKPAVDWERVEQQYRAGVMSLREIAAQAGVSHTSIKKRAVKEGWDRDLSGRIKAKADALVSKSVVSKITSAETAATERETIEANAQAIADVKLAHRADIRRGRGLVAKLFDELEGLTDRPDLVEELQQALKGDDDSDAANDRAHKLREILDRVMSLPSRVTAVRGLAEALKNLIGLERQAWRIDADEGDGEGAGRELTDIERAARLAAILERARKKRDDETK